VREAIRKRLDPPGPVHIAIRHGKGSRSRGVAQAHTLIARARVINYSKIQKLSRSHGAARERRQRARLTLIVRDRSKVLRITCRSLQRHRKARVPREIETGIIPAGVA